jgi:steroid 5-alpha reductase family enzyme
MTFIELYGYLALVILGFMTLLWVISLILKNTSIVDIFWGAGFVLVNWVAFALTSDGFTPRKLLLGLLVTIWGLRLSLHILLRNWGKGEDFRYQKFRRDAGEKWWWYSYFQTFLLQGAIMWIVSAPLPVVHFFSAQGGGTILDYLGTGLWIIGFFFEAVGDWQLTRFRADPKNKGVVLNSGVWRYTRHPNYFGDATQWWGFYLIGAAAGGFWAIFSPILMTFMLLRVSGVTLLEKTLVDAKPGYKEYVESTSPFIPWFPHKKKNENQTTK